jgi:hypothetical protein
MFVIAGKKVGQWLVIRFRNNRSRVFLCIIFWRVYELERVIFLYIFSFSIFLLTASLKFLLFLCVVQPLIYRQNNLSFSSQLFGLQVTKKIHFGPLFFFLCIFGLPVKIFFVFVFFIVIFLKIDNINSIKLINNFEMSALEIKCVESKFFNF